MKAIPAQRLLAAHARSCGIGFRSGARGKEFDPLIVFSPAMFLPAVISKAQALARHVLGASDVLEVTRNVTATGLLGVEADAGRVDGSPAGLLRGLLLARASEQVFGFSAVKPIEQHVDLDVALARYMTDEGGAIVRGESDDSVELSDNEAAEYLLGGGLQ